MTRECHVRICGGLGGKFPGATRRACGGCASWCFSWPSLAGREALIRAGSVSGGFTPREGALADHHRRAQWLGSVALHLGPIAGGIQQPVQLGRIAGGDHQ